MCFVIYKKNNRKKNNAEFHFFVEVYSSQKVVKIHNFIKNRTSTMSRMVFIVNLEKHCSKMFVGLTDREADVSRSDLVNSI